jgi:RHS repeat-associated protein
MAKGAGSSTSYIHSGHRYEPLVMTSQSKTKVWEASVRPYGKLDTMGAVSASNDFRLLGQWHHLEAAAEGLSQNHYRDYDPSIGRFIQADPLGFWGGQSLYAYVDGRPYDDVDPTGQCPWCVAALINAGFDIASQMLLEGKSFECIDWASVAFSALPLGKLAKWAKPLSLGQEIGIFRDAAKYEDNFGLGSTDAKDAIRFGKDWVGKRV